MPRAAKWILLTALFIMSGYAGIYAQTENRTGNTKSDIDFLLMKEDYQKAADLIEGTIKKDSLNPDLFYKLGLAYQKTFRYDKALSAFTKSDRLQENADARVSMGNCLIELGTADEAVEVFRQVFEKDSSKMMAGLNLANILIDQKKYQEAVSVYGKLSSLDTANSYFYRQLGFCYTRIDSVKMADSCFEKALAINSDDIICLQQLISNYIKLHLSNSAISLLSRYTLDKPRNPVFRKLMGEVYFSIKNYVSANIFYSKAISLGDSSAYIYQKLGIGYYSSGISFDTTNSAMYRRLRAECFNLAKSALEKSNEKDPNPITCYFLGMVYQLTGEYEQSVNMLQKAIHSIIPDVLPSIYIKLGSSYLALNQYKKVAETYQAAYIFQPDNSELLLKIGEIYDRFLSDKTMAVKYYDDYLSSLNAGEEQKISIKKRIKQLGAAGSSQK